MKMAFSLLEYIHRIETSKSSGCGVTTPTPAPSLPCASGPCTRASAWICLAARSFFTSPNVLCITGPDRADFLSYLSAGIVWRLEALAKRKGVDLADFDAAGYLSANSCECLESTPYFKYLGGEVLDVTADQLTAAQRKALKSGKPVTVPQGTIVRR